MSIFQNLHVHNWRQFANVSIQFHPRLTVLTGANGAGKTTILHILNRHWGWQIPLVSATYSGKRKRAKYWAGFWSEESGEDEPADHDVRAGHVIGRIEYTDRPPATIRVPSDVQETFAVLIDPMPKLPGVYVASHRPMYIHQKVTEIPTEVDAREQLFEVYLNEVRSRWTVKSRVSSPSYLLKRSLISLATFSYGSETIEPSSEARNTFEGFQRVLSIILPKELGFRRLRVRVPDVVLETGTGTFPLDAASGGISALIDVAWQVFLYSTLDDSFVVAIDEPEAHLHPALQRAMLPNLLEAFPAAQFIIATHNPLVVGSTEDSAVYVLRYNTENKVNSHLLDQVNKAGTANELLRDVLGVESTSAVWVEGALQEILARYKDQPLTQEVLEHLRSELQRLGLSRFLPEALDELQQ